MTELAIRFGVGDGQRRAATWKCWAVDGPGRNDVYLACRELRGAMKASLHKSGRWHVAFDQQFLERNAVREEWPTRFMETWQDLLNWLRASHWPSDSSRRSRQ